jgi:ubiquinone/menaquinone biosynthesis C-methylase UbiE
LPDLLYSPGNRFLDPRRVLVGAGLRPGQTVGDFGSGAGYYATAAAEIVGEHGQVYAIDIQEPALANVMSEARLHKIRNIITMQCDLEKSDFCPVPHVSCDAVILANILHQAANRQEVVKSAYRALKSGGIVVVIEWEPQGAVFGPSVESRISEQEVSELFTKTGFRPGRQIPTDPYHYAVTYIK